jgi:hypothetical protein
MDFEKTIGRIASSFWVLSLHESIGQDSLVLFCYRVLRKYLNPRFHVSPVKTYQAIYGVLRKYLNQNIHISPVNNYQVI